MGDNTLRINGDVYHFQYRRCNKPECVCHQEGHPGHGPYWYKYGPAGLRYVGRELPADVRRAVKRRESDRKILLSMLAREQKKAERIQDSLDAQEGRIDTVRAILSGEQVERRDARALGLTKYLPKGAE